MLSPTSLTIEHGLLGFLRSRPLHGYAIYQELTDPAGLGPVWRLKLSRLYALLHKLDEAGYLTTTLEDQDSRPPRRVFHLTAAGETAFLDWVQRPVEHGRSLRLEFLVKMYFARREGTAVAADLVISQREQVQTWLDDLNRPSAHVISEHAYGRLVYRFRQGQIEAMLNWLTLCEETFKDG